MNDKKNGVSRIQRHADGAASTTPPLFTTKPHRSHVPFVMVTPDMAFTSWSQHHFVAIAESQRQGRKASHNDSKQQQKPRAMLALPSCSRDTHIEAILSAHPVCGASRKRRRPDRAASIIRCSLVLQPLLPGHSAQNQTIFG